MPQINYLSVETIRFPSCTKETFVKRYLQPGIPCIIEGIVEHWPAYEKWTCDYLKNELGNTPVYYHHEKNGQPDFTRQLSKTNLCDFITRIENGDEIRLFSNAHPLYDFIATNSDLTKDVNAEIFKQLIPKSDFFAIDRFNSDFWPVLPPYPPQVFIAKENSTSPGHYDYDLSYTFHSCIWGNKSVKLFPYTSSSEKCLTALYDVDLTQPIAAKFFEQYPELHELQGWSVLIKPGQTLFIPSKMWHWFKYEQLSMAYVVRARSFNTIAGFCAFAQLRQGPPKTFASYAKMWRKTSWRNRSFWTNTFVIFERPITFCTKIFMKMLHFVFSR